MTFQGFFDNFNDSIDLGDTKCTDLFEFWDVLVTLRDTSCDYDRFFDLFGFTNHVEEGILRWVFDSTTIDKNEIGFLG